MTPVHGDPLAAYHDWPEFARRTPRVSGDAVTDAAADLLGVPAAQASDVRVEAVHDSHRVTTTELSWVVGFGPRQHAWLLHPRGSDPATLPGVLALHSHAGMKRVGAARMVALPHEPASVVAYRERSEDSRAFATDLAASGFTVLAPDAFTFGSRRFALGTRGGAYDRAAAAHEHDVAKLCAALDTTYAGMVAHDDLAALGVLASRCRQGGLGVAGFSGGGARAAALVSLDPRVSAAVIAAMMVALDRLPASLLVGHSWLSHPRGLASGPGLAGLATGRRRHHLLAVYSTSDPLFTPSAQRAADETLAASFAGAPGTYESLWSDAGHTFPLAAQRAAATHLRRALTDAAPPRTDHADTQPRRIA